MMFENPKRLLGGLSKAKKKLKRRLNIIAKKERLVSDAIKHK